MARIKIKDLPKDMKISKEEMRKVMGGLAYETRTTSISSPSTLVIRNPSAFTAFNWGTSIPQYEGCAPATRMAKWPKTPDCPPPPVAPQ